MRFKLIGNLNLNKWMLASRSLRRARGYLIMLLYKVGYILVMQENPECIDTIEELRTVCDTIHIECSNRFIHF